jgi:hypothetical protein
MEAISRIARLDGIHTPANEPNVLQLAGARSDPRNTSLDDQRLMLVTAFVASLSFCGKV